MTGADQVSVRTPNALVTVDYRTGNTTLRALVRDSDSAPPGSVVRHDGSAFSWGTLEVPTVLPRPHPVPLRWLLGAVPAIVVTLAVKAVGTRRRRFARVVRLAGIGRSLPPASDTQTLLAVRAVRLVSAVVPARWACLEQSTAAAVLLALAGRRGEWRHGVATDPVRLHAWMAGRAGHPVAEPADTAHYTPTCTPDGPVRAQR
ncbi:lasso peptide biosynthesis B2 protein [Streptomyces sp. NPDC058001]|uniref:lasso peptide biosynthesis B2 protein n=1 Tax=Streptomyces sp. NPDC058001 TaxID=3346300 RepID=UPI0036E923FD